MNVLVIDIGGTHIKVLVTGRKTEREFASGPTLAPQRMVFEVQKGVADWKYDVISIGYPGPVLGDRPVSEPWNLGKGWVGFNFQAAIKRPVNCVNDAVMQALGSYKSGKMLFLGLGTGLGSTLIVDGLVVPMELGHLPYKRSTPATMPTHLQEDFASGRKREGLEAMYRESGIRNDLVKKVVNHGVGGRYFPNQRQVIGNMTWINL